VEAREGEEGPSNTSSATVTVTVSAAADAPRFQSFVDGATAENAAPGTSVGQVVASDPDPLPTLSYTMLDSAGGRFAIDSAGVVRAAAGAPIDFEGASSHGIVVGISDETGRETTATLTVTTEHGCTDSDALAIEVDVSLPSVRVIAVLQQLCTIYGRPRQLRCDNGPEFLADAMKEWALQRSVHIHFSRFRTV
jgi:hypothetical protein